LPSAICGGEGRKGAWFSGHRGKVEKTPRRDINLSDGEGQDSNAKESGNLPKADLEKKNASAELLGAIIGVENCRGL